MSQDEEQDQVQLVGNEFMLSPEPQDSEVTPTRAFSSHSLAGEDIILPARSSLDTHSDPTVSPFTPSDGTRTPPNLNRRPSSTPPLLAHRTSFEILPQDFVMPVNNVKISSSVSTSSWNRLQTVSVSQPLSSNLANMRPPRVPHTANSQPLPRGAVPRHVRGFSNPDCHFLSQLSQGGNIDGGMSIPRRRTLSWDNDDTVSRDRNGLGSPTKDATLSLVTPESLLQPILHDDPTLLPMQPIPHSNGSLPSANLRMSPKMHTMSTASREFIGSVTSNKAPFTQPTSSSHPEHSNSNSIQNPDKNSNARPIWNPTHFNDTGSFVAASPTNGGGSPKHIPLPTADTVTTNSSSATTDYLSTGHKGARFSLEDVLNAYPTESIEETMLLRQLEFANTIHQNRQCGLDWDSDRLFSVLCPDFVNIASSSDGWNENSIYNTHSSPNWAGKQSEGGDSENTNVPSNACTGSNETFAETVRKFSNLSNARESESNVATNLPKGMEIPQHTNELMEKTTEKVSGSTTPSETLPSAGKPSTEAKKIQPPVKSYIQFLAKARSDFVNFVAFLRLDTLTSRDESLTLIKWIIIPWLGVCVALFCLCQCDIPTTGILGENGSSNSSLSSKGINSLDATLSAGVVSKASLWLFFVGFRQIVTLQLARISHIILIDCFIFGTKRIPGMVGPQVSLFLAMAKGWPFILFMWVLWDITIQFVQDWQYWRSWMELFNQCNLSGEFVSSDMYGRIRIACVFLSVAVTLKRALSWHIVGKHMVRNFRGEMASTLRKITLLNEITCLSKSHGSANASIATFTREKKSQDIGDSLLENFDERSPDTKEAAGGVTGYTPGARRDMEELLDEWEKSELQEVEEEPSTMLTILQFRRAWKILSGRFIFSPPFGEVRNREDCAEFAQSVFDCLKELDTPSPLLNFEVLCLVARDSQGNISIPKARELIRIFRPNRSGQLSKLDFAKSMDNVYKRFCVLLANLTNSARLGKFYESMTNTLFILCTSFLVLGVLGLDILLLVIMGSTVVIGLTFIIGFGGSKYLEGMMFVLECGPYCIGDKVKLNEVASQVDSFRSDVSWIIEKVDFFSTTARLATTREQAVFSNNSLASLRIINMNRSEKPNISLELKFPSELTLKQFQAFKSGMNAFIKGRPREWLNVMSFQRTRVETELGYFAYAFVVQHREPLQNLNAILTSKGDLFTYAIELQKELGIECKSTQVRANVQRLDTRLEDCVNSLNESRKD